MPRFEIEVTARAREVYEVTAANEQHARDLFEAGFLTRPKLTEIDDPEVLGVKELTDTE